MDDGSRLSWLIVVLLLMGAMFFAIAETAFASVSKNRIKVRADRGDPRARKALEIMEQFDYMITTILICTNIIHLAAASVVTVTVTRIWGVGAVTASTLLTTLAVFFFGEMLPKSIARKYSERLSLATAGILHFLMKLLHPAAALLTKIGDAAASLTKGEPEASVTENELYDLIEDMTEEGSLNEEQGELISSALQFGDVTVESILTSRVDLAAINIAMTHEEILAYIKEQNHSRLPVYEGSIDHIIGFLQIKKYIRTYIRRGKAFNIRPLLDEPYFVHQSTKIDDLLPIMSRKRINVAVVTDNYGGTLGIVTVEDILEELVGEIWDEDDRVEENIVPLPDGSYSVNAEEHLADVMDTLDIDYKDEEDDIGEKLMGELAYESFPTIPREGDSFTAHGMEISIFKMKQNRILRLKVKKTEDTSESETKEEEEA